MILRRLLPFLLIVGLATPAAAQLGTVPYTFTPGTTILSAEVNANFSTAYANALNRTGGTMTGTLTAQAIAAATGATYDIGATGTRFKDAYFSGIVYTGGGMMIASAVPGDTTQKLYNDGGTLKWAGSTLALGGAVGPGTAGKLAKFTGANAVGDSICTELAATLTCVNTVNATFLGGALTTASQTTITEIGTITAGTWNATIVGLAYGGTASNLAATGGTSQFLRQNSAGAAVTVVRPQVSDLSDGTNVALLGTANTFTASPNTQDISSNTMTYLGNRNQNTGASAYAALTVNPNGNSWGFRSGSAAANSNALEIVVDALGTPAVKLSMTTAGVMTITGQGTHDFSGTANSAQIVRAITTSAGTAAQSVFRGVAGAVTGSVSTFSDGFTTSGLNIQGSTLLSNDGVGGITLAATNASAALRLVTGGTAVRWGVNAAGDWVFGTSLNIMDGAATPTISSGGGTGPSIAGTASVFRVTLGTTPGSTDIVVAFNETFANAPACQANTEGTGASQPTTVMAVATTTQVTLEWHEAGNWNATAITVLCRGY